MAFLDRMPKGVRRFVAEALPYSHWGMTYFDIRLKGYGLVDGMFGGILKRGGQRALGVGSGLGLAAAYLGRHFDQVDGTGLDYLDAAFAGGRPRWWVP